MSSALVTIGRTKSLDYRPLQTDNVRMRMPMFAARTLFLALLAYSSCSLQSDKESSLDIQVSPPGVDAAEPAVAADAEGNTYVAYVARTGNEGSDLYVRKFDARGAAVGGPARVNPEPGQVRSWYGDPPVVLASPAGMVYVSWTARNLRGTNLMVSVSRDGGRTFGNAAKVNDDTVPASHGMHSIALGPDGSIYAAWLDERNVIHQPPVKASDRRAGGHGFAYAAQAGGEHPSSEDSVGVSTAEEPNSEVFFAFSKDGGLTFSFNKKIATEVCPCCKTSLAVDPDGRIYLSWRQVVGGEYRHIAVGASVDGGESFSKSVIVSDDKWQINACPVSGAALSAMAPGELDVLWYTAGTSGQPGLYFARSTDGGATFTGRSLRSNSAVNGTPVLTTSGAVFASAEGTVFETRSGKTEDIFDAMLPAAASTGDRLAIAFVRKSGKRSAVWLRVK